MTTLERMLQDPEFAKLYAEESFVIDALELVCETMEKKGIKRSELARRMGCSKAHVTKLLRGGNISARSIARMFRALEVKPKIVIE